MAQTSRSLSGGFWPISLPRFQGLKAEALASADAGVVVAVKGLAPDLLAPGMGGGLTRAGPGAEAVHPKRATFSGADAMLRSGGSAWAWSSYLTSYSA